MRGTWLGQSRIWIGLVFALLIPPPAYSHAAEKVGPTKPYADAANALDPFIAKEVADKELPALSIALVDDQTIVWAKGFGFADPEKKKPATADTVYRVGSVSKLFTDIAVMQLVERGALDLDEPVRKYLQDFKPNNKFDKEITLRQLMTHRSGLCRESPIGNYFDDGVPSLAKTVDSLNQTELVYEPETKTKYSNAAIATVGRVIEVSRDEAFPKYLQKRLLDPLGMQKSAFEPEPDVVKDLAKALMWTYQGREFPAPTFELGMAPAGSMYTTVNDLGKFLSVLFADGKGPHGQVLEKKSLDEMWKPQFAKAGEKTGFGLGFMISEFEGKRRIGHGGAIYGFSTELAALPDDKLGVIVVSSRDVTNAVTTHIANVALGQMLAVKQNKPLPKIEKNIPLKPEVARSLAGRYQSGDKAFDLFERAGRLAMLSTKGGYRVELRASGDALVVDDRLDYGLRIEPKGDKLVIGKDEYERVPVKKPDPPPAKWLGLIGEYGWDHNTLYILERDGKLNALIEWVFLYPLTEESADVYNFPDFGLYHGEKLIFTRDKNGRATQVEAAKVVFDRRKLDGENGETFKIKSLRPLDELRKEALAAKPPEEKGDFRKPDLVHLTTLDDSIKLDIRYATENNFLSTRFYDSAKAFMQRPAAEALVKVHKKLGDQGYGLLIHDGYRPWYVTKMFWDATPPKQRIFVADPAKGSRHNRGCAVDLTLYDRKTGKPIEMVGGYDEMSDRSYPDYLGGTSLQRWLRDLLRHAMEEEGFSVYEAEWWHFDYKDWKQYPILNLTFEQLKKE
jgi:CubicO group peptidase (beta-lactamase class C family)/D-alanyl-D-alanine dipeptidase